MSTLTTTRLTESMGAEITGVDLDRLLGDESVPAQIWAALREHGVLLFRGVGFTPETQTQFSERLGTLDRTNGEMYNEPGVQRVSMDPKKNGGQETVAGTFNWHMDGCTLPIHLNPSPATILTCAVKSETGGQTAFASTRAFFAGLDADEQARLSALRVVHSVAGSRRRVFTNPTPEQEASWAQMQSREHPLVWRHREGRPSLIIGGTTDHIPGMDVAEGRAYLDDLVARATTPDRVYSHEWSVGDTVIWDNPGMLHCVQPYEEGSAREMIRCTLVGEEPTE
ncbi:TauD/TfdA dioxygenase family protein [Tomitella biformata]|uniref:TauD/TfdA dioxygenase family protein n=1 Tax=Tomitella biformata TaxID=630403 RepID=UPI0004660739|nr:TauD/TfdA family dioxygenase [Tomitella biformata]